MAAAQYDLVVIGAGPGGYVAAIRAAQLGMRVACVELEERLGGTCLRVGCIPSKALLESSELYREARQGFAEHGIRAQVELDLPAMQRRKEEIVAALARGTAGLLKKNGIERVHGRGRLDGPGRVLVEGPEGARELAARRVILATGSRSAPLAGVATDGERIATSTEALAWSEVPKSLAVIGAGAIGLELGSVWSRLGSQVVVLEYLDRILPGFDAEIASEAHRVFAKQGLEFRLQTRVRSAAARGERCAIEIEGQAPLEVERVLVAVGRQPYTEGLGLESAGIRLDPQGRIPVDEGFRTSAEGIWAIGDVIRGPMLAHKAEDEGLACAEILATGHGHVDYDAIPSVVYTSPEVAGVGRTEEQLREAGTEYRKGSFPFSANGRAKALGQAVGRVKVLADARTDRILGVHILGPRAGDLVAEAATSIAFHASAEDLARTCHAHPTLAEALREAALAVDRRSIHS